MPQSYGDIAQNSTLEGNASSGEVGLSAGKPTSASLKWETASDPGNGGSFRRGKKALPLQSSVSNELAEGSSSKLIESEISESGVANSSSTASISSASSAQQLLLNNGLNSDSSSSGNGGQFYAVPTSSSTVSLPTFLMPQPGTPDEPGRPTSPTSTPVALPTKKRSMEGAFKALQSYLAPTYADQDAEFHRLFEASAVDPPLDRLVYVTPGAVNKELLYSGRIYVSQRYICFYSGVFKTLTIVIPVSEVAKLRKEKVLRMMPTAIEVVKEDGERTTFIHVSNRDMLFSVMFELWQNWRSGIVLSSGQLDQKVRQLYGVPVVHTSPSSTTLDIRWRNNAGEEEVDFIPQTSSSVPSTTGSLPGETGGIAFQADSASTSSVNSDNADDTVADNDDEDDEHMADAVDDAENKPSRTDGTLKSGNNEVNRSNNNIRDSPVPPVKASKHPATEAMVRASTAATAFALPDGSGSPQVQPRHRSREQHSKPKLHHSESVQAVSGETASHQKLARCRSRSTSNDRKRSPTRLTMSEASKKAPAAHEPTPTPTPSPSPTVLPATAVVPQQSIYINLPNFPPPSYLPCRDHQHLKRTAFDEEVPLPPELLAALIFGPGESWDALWLRYGASQVDYPPWEPAIPKPDAAAMQRGELPAPLGVISSKSGSYCLQLGWAVGPRYANISEKHSMFPETRPGVFYVMERETSAPGMPYGQDFYTLWRYCIRRLPARHSGDKIARSQMTVTGEVRYKKSIWRAFQGMIERNAQTGIDTFMTLLRAVLQEEAQKYAASAMAASLASAASPALPETPAARSARSTASAGTIRPTVAEETRTTAPAAALPLAPTSLPVTRSGPAEEPPLQQSTPLSSPFSSHVAPGQQAVFAPVNANTGRFDQWLVGNPQVAVRTLLACVAILLLFTFFLARRVAEVEEHLLRYGLPFHSSAFHQYQPSGETGDKPTVQASPEMGAVLTQLAQVAGQLSDSLAVLAEAMRNQNLNRPGNVPNGNER